MSPKDQRKHATLADHIDALETAMAEALEALANRADATETETARMSRELDAATDGIKAINDAELPALRDSRDSLSELRYVLTVRDSTLWNRLRWLLRG
jgi:hypothetical protein